MKILIAVLITFFASLELQAQNLIQIVPAPQEVTFKEGSFDLRGDVSVVFSLNDNKEEIFQFEQLKEEAALYRELSLEFSSDMEKRIVVGVYGIDSSFDRLARQHDLVPDSELGKEGYYLVISPDLILISASTKQGAFYGVQSLKQLMRSNFAGKAIPALEIKDWPDLEMRGMMDDISRGPVPTPEYMKQQIRRMAELKVNTLTYYTEHVVKTESHPVFAPKGGSLTIREWRELDEYANKYHIQLIGNFQSFGHFQQILKHPEYAHLGEGESLLSPAFEESYDFLEDIYEEMVPAFRSDYFHVNSDETFDLGKGASKELVDSLGIARVYAQHIIRIHEILTRLDKKILVWADIALKHPEIIDLLPKDIVMIPWDYGVREDFKFMIQPLKDAGFEVLISTGVLNSNSTIPDFNIAKTNINQFVSDGVDLQVKGMLNTIWDDGGFALFSKDWYGVSFAAEKAWNIHAEEENYDQRFSAAAYGSSSTGLTEAISKLNELASLKSTEKMNEAVVWSSLLPEPGNSMAVNNSDWDSVIQITEDAGIALSGFNPRFYSEDKSYIDHTINLYRILAETKLGLEEISNAYKSVSDINQGRSSADREQLLDMINYLTFLERQWGLLKDENRRLWLIENRTHAWSWVEEKYDAHISALSALRTRLENELLEFDDGNHVQDALGTGLEIENIPHWYLQGWLMIQPVPELEASTQSEHYSEGTRISSTFPNVTEEFSLSGETYRWRRVNTPYLDHVNFSEVHDTLGTLTFYAFAHIDSDRKQTVDIQVGNSGFISVYMNGETAFADEYANEFIRDEHRIGLELKPGRNHLMIKQSVAGEPALFSVRFSEADMRSSKNRYRIINEQ